MLSAVISAQKHLKEKFGDLNTVPAGTYAVPTETSRGPAFMRVVISEDLGMSGFDLFMDEDLTISWYN